MWVLGIKDNKPSLHPNNVCGLSIRAGHALADLKLAAGKITECRHEGWADILLVRVHPRLRIHVDLHCSPTEMLSHIVEGISNPSVDQQQSSPTMLTPQD